MRGLRGCYMPDDVAHYAVRSFEEFRRIVRDEVKFADLVWDYPDEFADTQAMWSELWDHAQRGSLELCVAIEEDNNSYGLTVSTSCARDYLNFRREMRRW
jgi:hypothetical protein